jgi:hypothetical protein
MVDFLLSDEVSFITGSVTSVYEVNGVQTQL